MLLKYIDIIILSFCAQTVQVTYTLVLEQLTAALEVQREECRQRASASQTLIRSNLDQIISSQDFLEQKVRGNAH